MSNKYNPFDSVASNVTIGSSFEEGSVGAESVGGASMLTFSTSTTKLPPVLPRRAVKQSKSDYLITIPPSSRGLRNFWSDEGGNRGVEVEAESLVDSYNPEADFEDDTFSIETPFDMQHGANSSIAGSIYSRSTLRTPPEERRRIYAEREREEETQREEEEAAAAELEDMFLDEKYNKASTSKDSKDSTSSKHAHDSNRDSDNRSFVSLSSTYTAVSSTIATASKDFNPLMNENGMLSKQDRKEVGNIKERMEQRKLAVKQAIKEAKHVELLKYVIALSCQRVD